MSMHIFDENDGPTVTLTLPRSLVLAMNEGLRRYVPVSAGIDGALMDEIDMQVAEQ